MNWFKSLKVALSTSVLTLALAGTAWAQQPGSQPNQQPNGQQEQQQSNQDLKSFTGTLTKVDTEEKTLSVKNEEGKTMQFHYNDQTKVTGAEDSIEGLSSGNGTMVTVQYDEGWISNTAVKIEVTSSGEMQGQSEQQPESQSGMQSSSAANSDQQSMNQDSGSSSFSSTSDSNQGQASSSNGEQASAAQSQSNMDRNANQEQARNSQNNQAGQQTSSLPQTASSIPLVALIGFASLGGAALLGKLRG